jgi:hypothetical protein
MTETFLFTVVDAFTLSGRSGPVLVPGIPQSANLPTMRIGAQIRLTAPDGSSFETQIAGFERISYGRKPPRDKVCTPISLPSSISKDHVIAGTDVFLVTAKSDNTENMS